MSAIKKFFDEERARKIRIQEMKKIKQTKVEVVPEVDQAKLDEAYTTVMNWKIYYPEDLVYYFYSLDREEYEYILERKAEFPSDVQTVLWGPPPVSRLGEFLKMKVADFTDAMYVDMKAKEQQAFDKEVEEQLKQRTIPTRPEDTFDSTLERLRTDLKSQEEELEKLMKGPTKRYVAPSMRKQVMLADPAVQEMQAKIEKTKNEISIYEKYIVDADDGWKRLKQLEFRDQIIQEMLAV